MGWSRKRIGHVASNTNTGRVPESISKSTENTLTPFFGDKRRRHANTMFILVLLRFFKLSSLSVGFQRLCNYSWNATSFLVLSLWCYGPRSAVIQKFEGLKCFAPKSSDRRNFEARKLATLVVLNLNLKRFYCSVTILLNFEFSSLEHKFGETIIKDNKEQQKHFNLLQLYLIPPLECN